MKKAKKEPKPKTYKCLGCNYRVPYPDTYCGECLCEENGL